jgi:hypothetical protein
LPIHRPHVSPLIVVPEVVPRYVLGVRATAGEPTDTAKAANTHAVREVTFLIAIALPEVICFVNVLYGRIA